MNVSNELNVVEKKSGTGFKLRKGQQLKIVDIEGQQVSDLFCLMQNDHEDYLSSGRTIDYLSRINFKEGDTLYSSKSLPMLKIIEDKVKSHDFLLTPCSKDTFKLLYEDYDCKCGCEENLISALDKFGINFESLPVTFNIFMNVKVSEDGSLEVLTPKSRPGDCIIFEAQDALIVAITSCSAPQSNGGSFKPIGYEIL